MATEAFSALVVSGGLRSANRPADTMTLAMGDGYHRLCDPVGGGLYGAGMTDGRGPTS